MSGQAEQVWQEELGWKPCTCEVGDGSSSPRVRSKLQPAAQTALAQASLAHPTTLQRHV